MSRGRSRRVLWLAAEMLPISIVKDHGDKGDSQAPALRDLQRTCGLISVTTARSARCFVFFRGFCKLLDVFHKIYDIALVGIR